MPRPTRLFACGLLLLALLAAWPVARTLDGFQLPKEALLCGFGAAALWRARAFRPDALDKWLALLLLAAVLATALAVNPFLAARRLGVWAAAIAVVLSLRDRADLRAGLLTVFVVAASLVALVALAQSRGFFEGLSAPGLSPGSLMGQRNAVGHFAALALPVAAALSLESRKPLRRWALCGAFVLLGVAVGVSRSRGALLVAPVAILAWAVADAWLRRAPLRAGAMLALAALSITQGVYFPSRLVWNEPHAALRGPSALLDYQHGSGRGRLMQWSRSLELVNGAPLLGVGPGNWQLHYPRVTSPGDVTFHRADWLPTGRLPTSDAIALLVEQGLVGVLLFAGAAWLCARRWWQSRRKNPAQFASAVGVAAGLALAGTVDAVLQLAAPAALAAVALGAGLVRRPTSLADKAWQLRPFAVALGALGLVPALAFASRLLAAGGDASFAQLEAAVRLDPGDLRAKLWLAQGRAEIGRCDLAQPHLLAARRYYPYHEAPSVVAARCASARR